MVAELGKLTKVKTAIPMTKKIEEIYSFVSRVQIRKIIVIGGGGNGSYLVPLIARLISTINAQYRASNPISLVIVDGDTVEKKNLVRQNFISSDIGENKAVVLATRYGSALSIDAGAIPSYVTSKNIRDLDLASTTLVVTCTDNLKSRKLIEDRNNKGFWLDLGNEASSGQVVLANKDFKVNSKEIKSGHDFIMPTVFEIFPDYLSKEYNEKGIDELSCADLAEESPVQLGFVNNLAAAIAINYIHSLILHQPINSHMTYFSIDNVFEHRNMSKSTVKRWISDYERFSDLVIS